MHKEGGWKYKHGIKMQHVLACHSKSLSHLMCRPPVCIHILSVRTFNQFTPLMHVWVTPPGWLNVLTESMYNKRHEVANCMTLYLHYIFSCYSKSVHSIASIQMLCSLSVSCENYIASYMGDTKNFKELWHTRWPPPDWIIIKSLYISMALCLCRDTMPLPFLIFGTQVKQTK